jgi:iron complex transport system substrate-binding protein
MKHLLFAALCISFCSAGANPPQRIVSLSPDVTEMLYGIGAFHQVVGISEYCTYPPGVNRLPIVGGWHNPNLEKLLALRPDLVIIDDGQAPFVEDKLRDLGLQVLVSRDHTVDGAYLAFEEIGRATGHERAAARLIAATRDGLLRVSRKTSGLAAASVVLTVDRTPGTLQRLTTATPGSFLAELVEIAGGRIAVPASSHGYASLNKEDLLAINPEVILDFIHGAKSRLSDDPMVVWRELGELKAVRNGRVYAVDEDFVPHATQRMVETAELFAHLIHRQMQ